MHEEIIFIFRLFPKLCAESRATVRFDRTICPSSSTWSSLEKMSTFRKSYILLFCLLHSFCFLLFKFAVLLCLMIFVMIAAVGPRHWQTETIDLDILCLNMDGVPLPHEVKHDAQINGLVVPVCRWHPCQPTLQRFLKIYHLSVSGKCFIKQSD